MEIITVKDLSFGYEKEPIFDKISFSICAGDFAAMIGANGTGKSTLLKLLLNECVSQTGSIHWFGQAIEHMKSWRKLGYVPQHNILMGNGFPATVQEVVQANLFSQIGFMRFATKKHREQTMEALKLVGMEDYAKRLIGNLSGGQQQRVMIARALVCNPEVLLLDEPTTGVDSKSCEDLYHLLKHLNTKKNLTVILITHDVRSVFPYLTKVFYLEDTSLTQLNAQQISLLQSPTMFIPKR